MAFEEIPDQPKRSNFWKPESKGELKEGVYVRCEAPKPGKEKFGLTYIIREPDGHEMSLPNHENLSAKMFKLKPGSYIKIEYLGKQGKEYHYKLLADQDYKEQTRLPDVGPVLPQQGQQNPIELGILARLAPPGIHDSRLWDDNGLKGCGALGEVISSFDNLKKKGAVVQRGDGCWVRT